MNFNNLNKPYIVAEIGVNHEGSISKAIHMINLAKKSGANAVKFQTYTKDGYVSPEQNERKKRITKFCLSRNDFVKIYKHSKKIGINFFSTPLNFNDVDFLNRYVPCFKVSSGDITFLPLIEKIAKKKKPTIISTGMSSIREIDKAIKSFLKYFPDARSKGKLMLMHCVAEYPPSNDILNLNNIKTLKKKFKLPIGYSDHSLGTQACEIAVSMGVKLIEKHFTYRRENQTFHDHKISSNPKELTKLVRNIKSIDIKLGSNQRKIVEKKEMFEHLRRSLCASKDIKKGSRIKKKRYTIFETPKRFEAR